MSCETGCFEAEIESCNDIVVRAGFPANYPIYWLLQRAFSANLHQRLTATNNDGDLIIPKADLPAGLLVKGGQYKIQVKDGNDYLQPVAFVFNGIEYSCIIAELVNISREESDNSELNIIQFKAAIVPDAT